MERAKRYLVFLVGLFINAMGVSLITKADLGTSPISSIPYVLSLNLPLTLGEFTILFSLFLIVLQLLILRKNFKLEYWLQVPVSVAFGYFIDLGMLLLGFVHPQAYLLKVVYLLLGCLILGAGVFLEVIADVVMLPGESFVRAIVFQWKTEFGLTKVAFDMSMTIIAAILSFGFRGQLSGVREGTVVAAVLVGFIARLMGRKLGFLSGILFGKRPVASAESGERTNTVCLAINRQYGSGGREIGLALSKELGIPFYDREIIQLAAESTGYSKEYISQREERAAGTILQDLATEMYGYSDQTPAPSDTIFEAEVKVMEEAARNGDCIIIGRCADVVLQDKVACLRIFLQAPLDFRVKRLMATEGLDEKEALRQARQTDRARAAYHQYYGKKTWGAAWNYNLCIDTSMGQEETKALIIRAYHSMKQQLPQSKMQAASGEAKR